MRFETITSANNPKIKTLLALQDKVKLRREKGLFVVEGKREVERCIECGYKPDTIFLCEEILKNNDYNTLIRLSEKAGAKLIINIASPIYNKVAYRGSTEGIIAEFEGKEKSLDDIKIGENPLIIVLEAVEKPGNLGAVLRSADAAGADAIILCDSKTDIFNPNLIRSSIGSVFSRQVAQASTKTTIEWLKKHNIKILTAQLQDSVLYYNTDMKKGTAIVMGTEATGLTQEWRIAADKHIKIPMNGISDSLNVSVSAAILLFEAIRQRSQK